VGIIPCQPLSPLTARTSANEVPCFCTYSPTEDGEVLLAVWPRSSFCCVTKVLWKGEERHRRLLEVRKFFLIVLAIQPTFMDSMSSYRWDFSRTCLWHFISYQRLTLPESTRFLSARKLKHHDDANEAGDDIDALKKAQKSEDSKMGKTLKGDKNEIDKATAADSSEVEEATPPLEVLVKKAHFNSVLCLLVLEFLILMTEL
jgi:hypothetical protein